MATLLQPSERRPPAARTHTPVWNKFSSDTRNSIPTKTQQSIILTLFF